MGRDIDSIPAPGNRKPKGGVNRLRFAFLLKKQKPVVQPLVGVSLINRETWSRTIRARIYFRAAAPASVPILRGFRNGFLSLIRTAPLAHHALILGTIRIF